MFPLCPQLMLNSLEDRSKWVLNYPKDTGISSQAGMSYTLSQSKPPPHSFPTLLPGLSCVNKIQIGGQFRLNVCASQPLKVPKFPRDETYITLTLSFSQKKKNMKIRGEVGGSRRAARCVHISVTAEVAGGASGKCFLHPV